MYFVNDDIIIIISDALWKQSLLLVDEMEFYLAEIPSLIFYRHHSHGFTRLNDLSPFGLFSDVPCRPPRRKKAPFLALDDIIYCRHFGFLAVL